MTEIIRDIVILFGAGASYGAGNILPKPPPLGKDLYGELATYCPDKWGPGSHLGRWVDKFHEDFELTMLNEVILHTPSLSLLEYHQPVAQFFARYRLDGSGNDLYSRLFRALKGNGAIDRITLCSLNYECLLESAIADLGIPFDYMVNNKAVAKNLVPLLKIHGSSN